MSIPKEPRQLMINVMYLVLTALLALNVSAEIFNAFEMVDGGLQSANASLDNANSKLPKIIRDGAKKKESYATYAERIDGVLGISADGSAFIDNIVDVLVDESGDRNQSHDDGDYIMVKQKKELKGKKNYDATTRLMVEEGKGDELLAKMKGIKNEFLKYVDEEDRDGVAAKLPINIDEEAWKNSPNKKAGWADYTFGHMPLGATMPIFTKYKNDIKASEAVVLNYLAKKVGGGVDDVTFDNFKLVSAPKKSYIIKGEKYESELFIAASAGEDSKTGISISVGGRALPLDREGRAAYTATASSVGKKTYKATATITNPVTGDKETLSEDFEYEVGERGVSVSPMKMNVFYIGVPNPVSVTAAGVPSNQIKVSMSGSGGASIKPEAGNYVVTANTPTRAGEFAYVNVSGPGLNEKREFRVKRIPNPTAKLNGKTGGIMDPGTFRAQLGVGAQLDNFDFDAKCTVRGYRMIYVPKREDAIPVMNSGARFGADALKYVARAKPGDTYNFIDVKAQCPGDKAPREINSLVFNIR